MIDQGGYIYPVWFAEGMDGWMGMIPKKFVFSVMNNAERIPSYLITIRIRAHEGVYNIPVCVGGTVGPYTS